MVFSLCVVVTLKEAYKSPTVACSELKCEVCVEGGGNILGKEYGGFNRRLLHGTALVLSSTETVFVKCSVTALETLFTFLQNEVGELNQGLACAFTSREICLEPW